MATRLPVAFLGLGIMGVGMAGQLLKKGFDVTVYNRSAGKTDSLKALGAKVAATPAQAAGSAEIVISMLSNDDAARNVWMGTDGALKKVNPNSVLIECSTISTAWVTELAAAAKDRQCDLLDAPVSGSKAAAESAGLVFLVGGADATLERARPVLAAMSKDIVHLGPTGSGALVKLINNFVCGVQAAALAEALVLIERSDLDAAKALAVLTEGAPGSPMVKMVAKRMAASDYTPNFLLPLMTKDLRYASQEAKKHSLELKTAATAIGIMQQAIDAGYADKDFSSIVELLRTNRVN